MSSPVTFVNVIDVDPSKQQEVIDILQEGTENVISRRPGFVSATILASDLPYYIVSDQGYQLFYKKPFPVDVDVTPRGNFRGLIGMPK